MLLALPESTPRSVTFPLLNKHGVRSAIGREVSEINVEGQTRGDAGIVDRRGDRFG